ncbi:hypothetical protein C8R48DRAFT_761059 [Suillus tomentosus]|nr:hypothetical protein C8R48DRAFT_761059 [Suillus tomentosus]
MATTTEPSQGIDQRMELLKRGVPIWPTQLRRYTEMLLPMQQRHDYNLQAMQIDPASINRRGEKGDWKEYIHPSGATYYYNAKTSTYTEMNIGTCSDEQLRKLESWIDASRSKIIGKRWVLVVDLMLARGEEIFPYYYVVPESKIITWVEPMDGYILFQECTAAWHWNHKRLELEAQYWKHVEYFPLGMEMRVSEVRNLRVKLNWYRVGEFVFGFATSEQNNQVTNRSAGYGTIYCRYHILDSGPNERDGHRAGHYRQVITYYPHHQLRSDKGHHEYLNHYGQHEARLIQTHSVGKRRRDLEDSPFMIGLAVTMLCIPIMVLKRLRNIYVDGLVNGVDVRGFTDDFAVQAKSQTTVASVIMAVNASILAIPGLGSQLTTKTLCSISFLLSVYCIIGCTMAQHFGQRLRSLDFAAYYLQGKMPSLVILTSIPSFLYLMSLAFSTPGFLAGIFTADFGLPLSARLGCGLTFVVGAGLVIPLMIASLGPGLIRQ